jgi:hypothetical protein
MAELDEVSETGDKPLAVICVVGFMMEGCRVRRRGDASGAEAISPISTRRPQGSLARQSKMREGGRVHDRADVDKEREAFAMLAPVR